MFRNPDFEKVKEDVLNMIADVELGKNLANHKQYLEETIEDVDYYITECKLQNQDTSVHTESKIWLTEILDKVNRRISGDNESFLNLPIN